MNNHSNENLIFNEENIIQLFGKEAAEDESFDRLQSYYVKNKTHEKVTANIPLRILVGHKGIGKSAIFTMAKHEDDHENRLSVVIKPDDILNINKQNADFHQMIRDWKTGLIEIIAQKVITEIGIYSDAYKEFLNKTGKIILAFTELLKNKTQNLVDLPEAHKLLVEKFLTDHRIVVYIDDLDRGWESRKEDIQRISALINAVRDLCNENTGLQIRISLRSDVYFLVRTSDESTDKIESYVIWHSWTNHEILLLLIKRIETYFGRTFNIDSYRNTKPRELAHFLNSVFEKRFQDSGKWADVPIYRILMSLIRKRPRDLIKLCTLAARDAYDKGDNLIGTNNFKAIFSEYSQGRLQDTVNEYKSELPSIERLLLGMKPSHNERKKSKGFIYDTPSLKQKLRAISEQGAFLFKDGKKASEQDLIHFLYKINFITARKDEGEKIIRSYFEENKYLSSSYADFGYKWEIHPAFRWALAPDISIFSTIELNTDE